MLVCSSGALVPLFIAVEGGIVAGQPVPQPPTYAKLPPQWVGFLFTASAVATQCIQEATLYVIQLVIEYVLGRNICQM